jgi:hypothetical protein
MSCSLKFEFVSALVSIIALAVVAVVAVVVIATVIGFESVYCFV